jgi:hypothetical protein
MKRLLLASSIFFSFATSATAQSSEAVQKAIKHPNRELNSGKADVYIHNKKRVTIETPSEKTTSPTTKKRKRNCGTRTPNKS